MRYPQGDIQCGILLGVELKVPLPVAGIWYIARCQGWRTLEPLFHTRSSGPGVYVYKVKLPDAILG